MPRFSRYEVRQVSDVTGSPITPDDRLRAFRTRAGAQRYIAQVGTARPGCHFAVLDVREAAS